MRNKIMNEIEKLKKNAGITESLESPDLHGIILKYNSKSSGWDVFKTGRNVGFIYLLESGEYGAETSDGIGWEGIDTIEDAVLALITN